MELEPKRKVDWLVTLILMLLAMFGGMALVLVTDDPAVIQSEPPPPQIMVVPDTKTVTVSTPPVEVIPESCTRVVKELASILVNTSKVSATQGALNDLLSDVASGIHEGMNPTDIVKLKQQARDLQTTLTGAFGELGTSQYYVDQNKNACS